MSPGCKQSSRHSLWTSPYQTKPISTQFWFTSNIYKQRHLFNNITHKRLIISNLPHFLVHQRHRLYIYIYEHYACTLTNKIGISSALFLKFTVVSRVLLPQQEYLRSSWNFFILRFAYHKLGCNFNLKLPLIQKPQANTLLCLWKEKRYIFAWGRHHMRVPFSLKKQKVF